MVRSNLIRFCVAALTAALQLGAPHAALAAEEASWAALANDIFIEHACGGFCGPDASLVQVRDGFVETLRRVVRDPQLRRVFDIATHKVEYVGEMNAVRERHLGMRQECLADIERALKRALRSGELPKGTRVRSAALGLFALFDGLLQNWMLDRDGFDLLQVGPQVFDAYLRGLRQPA